MLVLTVNNFTFIDRGPELQCLLKVKEDLSKVLIFQAAQINVSN